MATAPTSTIGAETSNTTLDPSTATASPSSVVQVPAVCFSSCNNAYMEAQMIGKTPPICDSSSAFIAGYARCISCLEANGDATKDFKTFISSKFQEWLDFCEGEAAQLMTIRTYQSTLVISDINGQPATSIVRTYTTTYALDLESTSTTTRSNSVSSVPLSNTTLSSTLPTETKAETPAAGNKAWIAGPVVGSICAIVLLSLGWWFLRRRKRHHALLPTADNKKERFEKAELHAEDAPQIPPTELEGSYPDPVPEMSANEIAAQEMLSSELRSPVEMPERQK